MTMAAKKMENFDSYKQIKNLISTGIKEKQAEAIVETLYSSRSSEFANLATKDQLNMVEQRLQSGIDQLDIKIDQVKSDLNSKIDQVKSDLNNKIDQVKSDLNNKIDQVEDRLNSKIDQVKSDLNNKIDQVEERLNNKIDVTVKEAKLDIIKWVVGLFVTMMLTLIPMMLAIYFK